MKLKRRSRRLLAVPVLLSLLVVACTNEDGDGGGSASGNVQRATLTITASSDDAVSPQVEQLLQSQLRAAGFELKFDNVDAATLAERRRTGRFQLGLWPDEASPDPSLCHLFCSSRVPSADAGAAGLEGSENWTRTEVAALDQALTSEDTALDGAKRASLTAEAAGIMADQVVSLPLYQQPTILAYQSNELSGPIGTSTLAGPFHDLNEWTSDSGATVIAAGGEPECADWLAACGASEWGHWILADQTLPHAFDVDAHGAYVPSPLLKSAPTVAESSGGMAVTYDLRDEAVWNDGQPITSADLAYTWQQVMASPDADHSGYAEIAAIDSSNPKRAVVLFGSKFAAWRTLFSGAVGVLPSHLLQFQDRHAAMANGYSFSGGPWVLESWQRGGLLTLVPNPLYWGTTPTMRQVVFRFLPSRAAEIDAFESGEVSALYPSPRDDLTKTLAAVPGAKVAVHPGATYETLWLNASDPVLGDTQVRRALAYAVARRALVDAFVTPAVQPVAEGSVLDSFNLPIYERYSSSAFSRYRFDTTKVDELMTAAGWTKGTGGIWQHPTS